MVSVLLDLNIWLMSVLEIQTNFTPFVACFYYFWYMQVIIKLNPGPRKNNTSYNFSFCLWNLNPTQDENFRGCSRMRGRGPKKSPPTLKSVTHILQWWNVAQLHLTQRRSKKKNESRDTLNSADISIFFTGNQQILLYQEKQI